MRSGEEVQRNLARELHDVLAQRLASAGLRLSSLKKNLPLPDGARKEIAQIVQDLQGLAYTIHDLSHRLHPAILDELGLVAALEKECRAFSREGKVRVDFEHGSIRKSLPQDHSLCLYRIAQESLRNISKHADARNVKVALDSDKSGIRMTIEDDGRGVPTVARRVKGLGLISMEERASLAGGVFSIRPRRPRGTQIEVQVPWKGRKK
jgi:signal transduction histidine kinase